MTGSSEDAPSVEVVIASSLESEVVGSDAACDSSSLIWAAVDGGVSRASSCLAAEPLNCVAGGKLLKGGIFGIDTTRGRVRHLRINQTMAITGII